MKIVLLGIITFYQQFVSPLLHQLLGIKSACRFSPTCTVYAQHVIQKYGAGKGTLLTARRVLHCQPYFSFNL
jgi:uncharacterized protein